MTTIEDLAKDANRINPANGRNMPLHMANPHTNVDVVHPEAVVQEPSRFAKTVTIEALADNTSTEKIIVPFGVDPSLGWIINVVGYAGQITHAQLDAYGDVEVIAHNNTNTVLTSATVTVTLARH